MTRAQLSTGEIACTRCKQFKWPIEFGLKMGRRLPLCKSCVREQARKRKLLAKGLPTVADPIVLSQPPLAAAPVAEVAGPLPSPGRGGVNGSRPAARVGARRGGSFIAPKQSTPSVTEPPLAIPRSVVAEIEVTDADLELLRTELGWLQDGPVEPRINYRMQSHRWNDAKIRAALEMVRVRA